MKNPRQCKANHLKLIKKRMLMRKNLVESEKSINFASKIRRSGARVAEEARLESVYTPKAYPEFESRSLRKIEIPQAELPVGFIAFQADDTYFIYNRRMQWSWKDYGFIFCVA